MLKRDLTVSAFVASILASTAVACGTPASPEPSESSASAIKGISPCVLYPTYCGASGSAYGHTECLASLPDAGLFFPGPCPTIGQPCDSSGPPCSVEHLPAGATGVSCVQAAAFPGQVAPSTCLAN